MLEPLSFVMLKGIDVLPRQGSRLEKSTVFLGIIECITIIFSSIYTFFSPRAEAGAPWRRGSTVAS
jgi:hypothetical protein